MLHLPFLLIILQLCPLSSGTGVKVPCDLTVHCHMGATAQHYIFLSSRVLHPTDRNIISLHHMRRK